MRTVRAHETRHLSVAFTIVLLAQAARTAAAWAAAPDGSAIEIWERKPAAATTERLCKGFTMQPFNSKCRRC
jgi:hypothetical protein